MAFRNVPAVLLLGFSLRRLLPAPFVLLGGLCFSVIGYAVVVSRCFT